MARKSFSIFVIVWVIIVAGSLSVNLCILHRNSENTIRTRSEALFDLTVTAPYRNVGLVAQSCILGDMKGGIGINASFLKGSSGDETVSFKNTIIAYVLMLLAGLLTIWGIKARSGRKLSRLEAENKELRETNTAKDRFFNIIAHDLKTPAANIKSLAETLNENFAGLSPEEQKNCIDMLLESAKTHNNMLNTLLDLARVRTGSTRYCPERLDMRALADEVLVQTKLQALRKRITQTNCVEECFALADKNMITTVVRNIVVNAIKFTYPDGQVVVRAQYDGDNVLVSVSDSGKGIDKETADRIFDADYNKSTVGTFNEPGTGLGLVLCKEFVERNNGKIWLESVVGTGTTFFFTLPADEKK